MDLVTNITILVLAGFVGFEVISKVPNTLHTPLMSAHQRDPRHRAARRPRSLIGSADNGSPTSCCW